MCSGRSKGLKTIVLHPHFTATAWCGGWATPVVAVVARAVDGVSPGWNWLAATVTVSRSQCFRGRPASFVVRFGCRVRVTTRPRLLCWRWLRVPASGTHVRLVVHAVTRWLVDARKSRQCAPQHPEATKLWRSGPENADLGRSGGREPGSNSV